LGNTEFATQALDFINKCAYSDYQRTKVYWRTDKDVKKSNQRKRANARGGQRANKVISYARPTQCPTCGGTACKHNPISHKEFDLRFSESGVKRWITRTDTYRYRCWRCATLIYPEEWVKGKKPKFGRGLIAWVLYQNIGQLQSTGAIMTGLSEIFGYSWLADYRQLVSKIKAKAAADYSDAYEQIRRRIQIAPVVHVDETKANVQGVTAYVWVFTTLEEVIYVYSDSREAGIVAETLGEFSGILVSDFYPGYDSFPSKQQRCLIHLIRDLNDSLFKNPFDDELKVFVVQFGNLLKPIITTIDRHGLKKRFLRKHKEDVTVFFRDYVGRKAHSELVVQFQSRFKRNEHRLFTFLDHDGLPWNNNNAEVAIKAFAMMRRAIGGSSTEDGIVQSLKLLSISQTLNNKNLSFLEFLKSGKATISDFLDHTEA
jgi:hypothetical protein